MPPPDARGRASVLAVHARAMPLARDVDAAALADATPGWSGAQLENLCREAAMGALREALARGGTPAPPLTVAHRHFVGALARAT